MPKLVSILKSVTIRQSLITSVATFLTAGIGAVFYLALARLTGPREYGFFSLGLQIMFILAPLAEVGTSTILVRFVGQHAGTDNYLPFAALALRLKILLGVAIFLGLAVFAKPIAIDLLHQPDVAPLLPIAGIGVLGLVLVSFVTSTLQGLQKFIPWGLVQVLPNLIRLVLVVTVFAFASLSARSGLALFVGVLFVGFLLGWRWLDKRIITAAVSRSVWTQFWAYGKWTAAFTIASALVSRLDSLLTARFLDISQTGIYSLALTMSSFLPQLTGAIGAVMSPKFTRFTSHTDMTTYRKKALLFSTGIGLGVSVLMIPTALVVIRLTGRDFTSAFMPFLIILAAMCIFTITGPIRDSILYAHSQPRFFFYAALLQGVVTLTAGLILVPQFGIIGAALSNLASHIFLALICIWYAVKISKQH